MNIKDVWVTLRVKENKSLKANLYWLMAWRWDGVYICDGLVDREIELSNGNMYWSDTQEKLEKYKFCLENDIAYEVIINEKIAHINGYGKSDGFDVLASDNVTEANKRNKRLNLIGSRERYKSDGIEMIKYIEYKPIYKRSLIDTNDKHLDTCEADVEVGKKVTVNVTDYHTLSLTDYDYLRVDIKALDGKKKHLRLLEANDSGMLDTDTGIHIESENITVEWSKYLGLSNYNLKSLRRLNSCVIFGSEDNNRYDFSNIDYIDPYDGVSIDAPGKSIVLDFGNKFICMTEASIKSPNTDVLIVYSNPKMTEVLEALERNNEDGYIKIEYQGE